MDGVTRVVRHCDRCRVVRKVFLQVTWVARRVVLVNLRLISSPLHLVISRVQPVFLGALLLNPVCLLLTRVLSVVICPLFRTMCRLRGWVPRCSRLSIIRVLVSRSRSEATMATRVFRLVAGLMTWDCMWNVATVRCVLASMWWVPLSLVLVSWAVLVCVPLDRSPIIRLSLEKTLRVTVSVLRGVKVSVPMATTFEELLQQTWIRWR